MMSNVLQDEPMFTDAQREPRVALSPSIPGVELCALTLREADRFYNLVQRNREHLTQWGDYEDLVAKTPDELRADFRAPLEGSVRRGIWYGESLIGLASLTRVARQTFCAGVLDRRRPHGQRDCHSILSGADGLCTAEA